MRTKATTVIKSGSHKRQRLNVLWKSLATLTVTIALLVAVVIVTALRHESFPNFNAADSASLQHKIEQAQSAARAGKHQILRFDESDVNSLLHLQLHSRRDSSSAQRVSIKDVRVRLMGDRIDAYIVLASRLSSLTVQLDGRLYSRSGVLQFEPTNGKIGSLPIPQLALAQAVQNIANGQTEELLRLHGNISDLKVENSQLVIAYN